MTMQNVKPIGTDYTANRKSVVYIIRYKKLKSLFRLNKNKEGVGQQKRLSENEPHRRSYI